MSDLKLARETLRHMFYARRIKEKLIGYDPETQDSPHPTELFDEYDTIGHVDKERTRAVQEILLAYEAVKSGDKHDTAEQIRLINQRQDVIDRVKAETKAAFAKFEAETRKLIQKLS